jgi:hypothetical protein
MKKIIFILSLLLCLSMYSQEKKWRTLTVGNLSGITFNGKYLNTTSVALDYELKNGYSISSWAGVNYNYSYNGGWASGQATLNKKIDKYNIGAGVMYGSGNKYTPFPDYVMNKDVSGIITISRRFKL